MYSEWLWYSLKSRPPKKAALNRVVAYCETPPPMASSSTPRLMKPPGAKPLARVRGPTCPFTENVPPGSMTTPRVRSEMRWMLMTRD